MPLPEILSNGNVTLAVISATIILAPYILSQLSATHLPIVFMHGYPIHSQEHIWDVLYPLLRLN